MSDRLPTTIPTRTATLFSASAESGALLAGAPADQIAGLKAYGYNLGIAFQLVDDALDYSGRAAQMGKSVGDDFREAKVTLPVILAFSRADDEARTFWTRVIETGPQHEIDLKRAIAYVEETGAIADTRDMARRYVDAARDALAPLPKGEIRDSLLQVADFSLGRAS